MPYSEAHKRATIKYQVEKMDNITIRYAKSLGVKEMVQKHAKLTGESMSAFILRACLETMERDKAQIAKMMKESRK